jgi:hypothetical protein
MARAVRVDFTPGEVYNPAVASSGVCSTPQSRRIVEIVLQSIKLTTGSEFCTGISFGPVSDFVGFEVLLNRLTAWPSPATRQTS